MQWKDIVCQREKYLTITGVAALGVLLSMILFLYKGDSQKNQLMRTVVDPDIELAPSPSILKSFKKAAVSSDSVVCSEIGRDILAKNGSAVDAAVAVLLCSGIVNMEAMGIGGGVIMTVYIRKERKAFSIVARESAPAASYANMFFHQSYDKFLLSPSRTGGLAVGVPGELKGYWEAWRRFGKLPWYDLVEPSIILCRAGYQMSIPQRDALKFRPGIIEADPNLRSWFLDEGSNEFKRWGSKIVPTKLCETYEIVANVGGLALHDGPLTRSFVDDVKRLGGVLSEEDMRSYRVDWATPLSSRIGSDQLYTAPPPASGALLSHILHTLEGFKFTPKDFSNDNSTIKTIHRVVESYKYAFAHRAMLGDPNFVNVTDIVEKLLSPAYGDAVRAKIDIQPHPDPRHYEALGQRLNEFGTNHVSVLSSEGDAVAATSSINLYFGAGATSEQTGIVLNDVMDDFSNENSTNYFNLPPSLQNLIEPGKKPMSSACPTIIVDSDGEVKLVIGASGGTRIITAVAWVILRMYWFGENLKQAVDASRIHHQLVPNVLNYEYGLLKNVVDGLKSLGHQTERVMTRSVVCGIAVANGSIHVNADFRKFGGAVGLD
ncbi:gamma-glutamyltranspeptidase [Nesidiocoris tenuis]|uniref:Gamma-glutamyltranspeptidase n=1 Tax=Nesidiocoris tenuis TaxID=355587 RepID=A0ABN7BAF0_9HEMI|nr:gamma-glutamyltranspeptidase [Nesidiocoris tenuis]